LQVEKAENGRAMVGGKRKCTVDWSRKNEEVKDMKVENGKVKNKQAQNEKAKNSRVKGKGRCTIDWSWERSVGLSIKYVLSWAKWMYLVADEVNVSRNDQMRPSPLMAVPFKDSFDLEGLQIPMSTNAPDRDATGHVWRCRVPETSYTVRFTCRRRRLVSGLLECVFRPKANVPVFIRISEFLTIRQDQH
jgi:hypothetical protein